MNCISDQFPLFDNIYQAIEFITNLERNASKFPEIMPPNLVIPDPFVQVGYNLAKEDFIVTRLQCNNDDVAFYKMLNIDNGIPYLTDFKRFSFKPNLYHSNFIFRGQRKDFGELKANLFRDASKRYYLDDMIKVDEMFAFIAQHPLVQLLGIKGFELLGGNTKFQANLYGLAQHYYNKTVELDFSSSIDVAAFFATTSYDSDTDSYIPIGDDYNSIGVIYALPISSLLTNNVLYGAHISSIGKQFNFRRPEKQLGFLVECEDNKDLVKHPLLLQVRFRHNREIACQIYKRFNNGDLIAPADSLEKYWKLKNPNNQPFSVSNKAIELNVFFNPKESKESIRHKLESYNDNCGNKMFKFSNKEFPEFPREILEEYWNDIKNGWWEDEFCENIYFPNNNDRLKEALMNLPKDPRYVSAFKE